MKKNKLLRKAFVLLLAVVMVFTAMPFNVDIAEAAAKGTLTQTNLTGYNLKSSKYMQIWTANYQRQEVYIGSATDARMPIKKFEISDFLVFCAEHGVTQKSVNLEAVPYLDSKFYQAYDNYGYRYAIDNMYRVLLYGPVTGSNISELENELGFKQSDYYGDNASSYKMRDWIAATQMLIWECQQLMRDEDFKRVANGLYYQDSWRGNTTSPISQNHYLNNITGTPALDIYNYMASEVRMGLRFDRAIASTNKIKPKPITISEDITYPHTITLQAGSYAGDYTVVDDKGNEVSGIKINFVEAGGDSYYEIVIENASVLDKTLTIKHNNAAAKRADKYLNGPKGSKYERVIWEYETKDSHTQGFISGLYDPAEGYFKLTRNGIAPQLNDCAPPDVNVFPTISIPVNKVDANTGWDGSVNTPMGDAGLDAAYTLERQIGTGAWETIDIMTTDDMGSEIIFMDQPFTSPADLQPYFTESGSVSGCSDHPIYGTDGEGNPVIIGYEHAGMSRTPKRRDWDVTVNYRITESRPDGRYINPDPYAGVRTYTFRYQATASDMCTQYCQSLPWTAVTYTFNYGSITGEGGSYTVAGTAPSEDLTMDLETFVNDEFRGDLQVIKSNEPYDPFKDSPLGGAASNVSIDSHWTIQLKNPMYEGTEYVHLVSMTPAVLAGGTHEYTVSRTPGIENSPANPMKVGTNGVLLVKDLPYGEYIVTETKADDPMYVLEQFEVKIDEHNGNGGGPVNDTGNFAGYGQAGTNPIGAAAAGTGDYWNNRYDANLRDKVKSNVIKLEKTDSETGKTVRMEGTKVYIRFKGNPDYTDEENRQMYGTSGTEIKNIYNRFLPNAEQINSASTNYTFELDENGEIDIPYQLPYGIYEINEWLLPEGYYVGQYDEKGNGTTYDFGDIAEGIRTKDEGLTGTAAGRDEKTDTYSVYDSSGQKVVFKDKSEYTFGVLSDMVVNRYTFRVTEQPVHKDGNITQLVTYEGVRSDADGTYDNSDHPYTNYYKVAAAINNQVKGKIEISKEGEVLTGFNKETKDGYTIFRPVFEKVSKLKDAVFGIFAAEDIVLKDGSEGPKIFDAETGEEIFIPKKRSTNLSNAAETITAFLGKLKNPKTYTAKTFDTGDLTHSSGAELWYLLEREASAGNVKRTLYVTPEQKDTTYSYSYTETDGEYNYRWDVLVVLRSQAGGRNITEVKITKTTEVAAGYTDKIPLTTMTGSVGTEVLDPIKNYMAILDPTDWSTASKLEAYEKTYIFEADGKVDTYEDGTGYEDNIYLFADNTEIDLSQHTQDRYTVKHYDHYLLTAADVADETRVVQQEVLTTPGVDGNGDGDFDDPEDTAPVYELQDVNVTKKAFEWAADVSLLTPAAGGLAMYESGGKYYTAAKGYYQNRSYTSLAGLTGYTFVETDEFGNAPAEYVVPDGWSLEAFTGDEKTEPHYIIISQTDAVTGDIVYRVFLDDMTTWQQSTADGNFAKAAVQVYEATYTQEADDPNGFTAAWDGFSIDSRRDIAADTATAVITKHSDAVQSETIDTGLGWEYEDAGGQITFRTIPITAPIYFLESDGIKTEMYYKGGVAYTHMYLPKDAVDYMYEHIVPTLNFIQADEDGNETPLFLDWYSSLSPTNTTAEFNERNGLPDGVSVIAKRHDSTVVGEHTYYTLDIVTNQTEDAPLEITFADEYKMRVYTAETASGNGVGVIDLFNTYKTTVYKKSELIEVVTSLEDGKAHSSRLPLGEYVVREISADDNFLNTEKAENVELKYKDQFTPIVWAGADFSNTFVETEIDISKVFETAFKSDTYQPPKRGQEVIFGLYSGENFAGTGAGDVDKAEIPADTLIDVIKITYEDGGSRLVSLKLPEGNYYLKEIKAPDEYIMSSLKYNFVVKEDTADYSVPAIIAFSDDEGISGTFVIEGKGRVKTTIKIENRFPMPEININGTQYPLDTSFDGDVKIKVNTDYTTIITDTVKGNTLNVTFHSGKQISMVPDDNTFDYTIDGVSGTFVPELTYTGYDAEYEEPWEQILGEDLTSYTSEFVMTGAGTDKDAVVVTATIIHSPAKKIITKQELIDPAQPELGYHDVTVETGVLTTDGYQIFEHQAVIKAADYLGVNTITGDILRITTAGTSLELLDMMTEEIILEPRETIIFTAATGAVVTVSMNTDGIVNARIQNTLAGGFADTDNAAVTSTGLFGANQFNFAKNATLGRQDTSADKLMIKINADGTDAFAIENNKKPEDTPVPSTPTTVTYILDIIKTDAVTGEKLAGAEFEFYGSKEDGGRFVIAGEPIVTAATREDGCIRINVPGSGTYFIKETTAPEGYRLEDKLYTVVIKAEDADKVVSITIPNKPSKPSIGTTATGPDGEKEIIAKEKTTVIDRVRYANLTPGLKYTIEGQLINKATGKVVTTANKTFITEKESGVVKVTFTFNGKKYEDKDLVVFEYLYLDGELITSHADINDKGQTVLIIKGEKIGVLELTTDITYEEEEDSAYTSYKTANPPQTGYNSNIDFWSVLLLMSLIAIVYLRRKGML